MAHGGKRKGAGRKPGATDTVKNLREMILVALDRAGGIDYLRQQATETPTAFLSLIGKVLPLQHEGADGGPISLVYEWRKPSESTAATNHAPSSSRTMNGHNGSASGSHTDGAGKPSPTSRN
jgi:hypothetical protein